jgi:hypothetical protein
MFQFAIGKKLDGRQKRGQLRAILSEHTRLSPTSSPRQTKTYRHPKTATDICLTTG